MPRESGVRQSWRDPLILVTFGSLLSARSWRNDQPSNEEVSGLHHPGSNELLFLALDFPVIVADHAMAPATFRLRPVSLFKSVQAPAVIDSHLKPHFVAAGPQSNFG